MAVNMTSRLVALMIGCLLKGAILRPAVLVPEKKRIDFSLIGKLKVFENTSWKYEESEGVLE
jgi:hypothetical protein